VWWNVWVDATTIC